VLLFLWEHSSIWRRFLDQAFESQLVLCEYAYHQGLETYISDWIAAEVPEHNESHYQCSIPAEAWRGMLLRSLVSARLSCAADNSADTAIELLLVMAQKKSETKLAFRAWISTNSSKLPTSGVRFLSILPAVVSITSALCSEKSTATSSELFDQFFEVQNHANFKVTPFERDYNNATLAQWHPTRPNPDFMLDFLRTHYVDEGGKLSMKNAPKDAKSYSSLRASLVRTQTLLKGLERSTDLQYVAQKSEEIFGTANTIRYVRK